MRALSRLGHIGGLLIAAGALAVLGAGPLSAQTQPVNVTGPGTYTGKSAVIKYPIELREGDPDLVVIVEEDLDVLEDVTFPPKMVRPNARSNNIILVSLRGKVTVAQGVYIGGGMAAEGTAGNGMTPGGRGVDGGWIVISGVNVDVSGELEGNDGGFGGPYTWDAASPTILSAGTGGRGGGIILSAMETMRICWATAGEGGWGGVTRATKNETTTVVAVASGGDGGDISIQGDYCGGTLVEVEIGEASGGTGGEGGWGDATAYVSPRRTGADATASGGKGGAGGTVDFVQAVVLQWSTVSAGDGGAGGDGLAYAGDGKNAPFFLSFLKLALFGGTGGDATGIGGDGGPEGSIPDIPTRGGQVPGQAGKPGRGGLGSAVSGAGGRGVLGSAGGSSGIATAYGGKNGAGVTAPLPNPNILGPFVPVGATGGARARVIKTGAP